MAGATMRMRTLSAIGGASLLASVDLHAREAGTHYQVAWASFAMLYIH